VGTLGTYGLTIIIDHGGADYSIYGSLATVRVDNGAVIQKGDVIGTVGTSDPDFPAHLHFEIRRGSPSPAAIDPAAWLRAR
jgi:septal ring factor EnvC (AmiA/AmiB activator)